MEKELIVEIEELSNLGSGVAKIDGMVIFVENACPKDKLRVKVTKKTKNYLNAEIVEIVEPSPYRVEPFCPMQKICGACQLQFIDYNYQLQIKKQIIQNSMRNIEGITVGDVIASPQSREYRHKIQYPIAQTQNSKRILAGYYKPKSHDLVNIKYCPIQPKICDEIIEYIRVTAPKYEVTGYNERKHAGDLRHVVIRSSASTGKNLVVLVVAATKSFGQLNEFAKDIYEHFEDVSGVFLNYNPQKSNLILSNESELIAGEDYIEENLCEKTFRIGPNTFFQVNPKCADKIFSYIKNYVSENFEKAFILDLYAGIATFGIVMSDIAGKVVSVEENKDPITLADKILKLNGIKNVELHNMETAKYLQKEIKTKNRKFDITIIDPPRKGCTQESLDLALSVTNSKIIYVSCNPQTLARDLEYLISKGAKASFIQPFDMFCHTYHVESVVIIDVEGVKLEGVNPEAVDSQE